MANIKIELGHPVIEGMPLSFRAPCNCTEVNGIKVSYPDGEDTEFIVFSFADAHGNNLAGLGNLFAANAMVRVVLDPSKAKAYIQNADTNAYLEGELAKKYSPNNKPSKTDVGLGNVPNVSTNDQTPSYTAASTLAALVSGEKLSVAFGKIAKAVSNLIAHLANKSNPHGVTAAQVGAVPTTRKVNGKALSSDISLSASDVGADASGAASGVQTNLNNHANNKNNPHGVTVAQIGAAPASHVTNKSNPHGVTYAQVGAAPAPIISQTDINAGSTALETGRSYHVYE